MGGRGIRKEGRTLREDKGKAEDPRSSSRAPSGLFRQAGRASIWVTRMQQTLGGSPDRQWLAARVSGSQ